MDSQEFELVVDQIANSKKYRTIQIPRETISDLLKRELSHHRKKADAIKAVKAKLHNIAAPYLDDLDYSEALASLESVFSSQSTTTIEELCSHFLLAHHSTRERMPYLSDFYSYIFEIIGNGCTILDLACGLNPFALGLVPLPDEMTYTAYDIHLPRIKLINRFFNGFGIQGSAEYQDILVRPPSQDASAVFLFKEIHRMEKRRAGASRSLLLSLNAKQVFLSLPTHSLNGKYDLRERMDRLINATIQGEGSLLTKKEFPAETIYYVKLNHG